jgi:AAA domain, putative AbiEii toxin, Type IV TA system/AAA ATPase domain
MSASHGLPQGGYRMVDSVTIQNFRCFETVEVANLAQINLLVGRNASGKTAFLEGLFLAAGRDPGIALRLRSLRGLALTATAPLQLAADTLWNDLFHHFDTAKPVSIQMRGDAEHPEHTRTLALSYSAQLTSSVTLTPGQNESGPIKYTLPVMFEWAFGDGSKFVARPTVIGDQLQYPSTPSSFEAHFFSVNTPLPIQQNATFFSELIRQSREDVLVAAVKGIYPFVTDLTVVAPAGQPTIYAKLRNYSSRVPIGLVSAGLSKFISVILAITLSPGGIVLVDEIDNGFYFDTLPHIWETLLQLCRDHDVQLFASTHSRECLQALTSLTRASANNLMLLRTERTNGSCIVKQFHGSQLLDAIEEDVEVR